MNLIYNILYIFFVLNGLFWSLATHTQHCYFAKIFNIKKCPGTHIQHILFVYNIHNERDTRYTQANR